MFKSSLWSIILFSTVFSFSCFAQQRLEVREGTDEYKALSSIYAGQISRNSQFYNGSKYVNPFPTVKGFPYLLDFWEKGGVWYNQQEFRDISLLYNTFEDELLTEHFDRTGSYVSLRLVKEKIEGFSIEDRLFVHLQVDSMSVIKSGFYELLYNGSIPVYAKRIKQRAAIGGSLEEWQEKDKMYVKKYDQFYPIRNKRTLLKVLGEQKKALKAFIRSNNLIYRNNPESTIVETVRFFEELSSIKVSR
ncbi:MAG: hypothetical protein ACFCUU_06025 [Cyclobacteriaceae bacterium]